MEYIKVIWFHSLKDEPSILYSEIDENRFETRKVEVFRNGTYGIASKDASSEDTRLGEVPVPCFEEISEGGEFTPFEITKDEFEKTWFEALSYSK